MSTVKSQESIAEREPRMGEVGRGMASFAIGSAVIILTLLFRSGGSDPLTRFGPLIVMCLGAYGLVFGCEKMYGGLRRAVGSDGSDGSAGSAGSRPCRCSPPRSGRIVLQCITSLLLFAPRSPVLHPRGPETSRPRSALFSRLLEPPAEAAESRHPVAGCPSAACEARLASGLRSVPGRSPARRAPVRARAARSCL